MNLKLICSILFLLHTYYIRFNNKLFKTIISYILPVTGPVWHLSIAFTHGGDVNTSQILRVPSFDAQHNFDLSLLANFNIVTASEC